jgi:ornithine carbamoyltransferase
VDGAAVRTCEQSKLARFAAAASRMHVVNALTNEEHPCQALADRLTLCERLGSLAGRSVTYVGDGNTVAYVAGTGRRDAGTAADVCLSAWIRSAAADRRCLPGRRT